MEIERHQVWDVGWVLKKFSIQLLKGVDGVSCRMSMCTVV
jgi:hypothetical protein